MAEAGLALLLGSLASPDNVERKRAEAALEEFIGRQGFFPSLVQKLRSGQLTPTQQLTGIAIVKNMHQRMPDHDLVQVLTDMSAALEGGELSQGSEQHHRALVPLWVSASAKLMCRAMGGNSSTIAPVQELLFRLLNVSSTVDVGVMCCRELTVELPQEFQAQFFESFLATLVAIALPESLAQSPTTHSFSPLTNSSLHVVAEIIDQHHRGTNCNVASLLQGATMPTCLFVASFTLREGDEIHNQCIVEALRLLLHVLDASHSEVLKTPQFFHAIMESIEVDVETMRAASEESYTTIHRAMALRWETFARVLKKKKSTAAVVRLFSGMLEPVLRLILETCMIPDLTLSTWDEDVNAFLKMEGERRDEISWTPRDVAVDCADLMLKRFGSVWMSVVLRVGGEILATPLDGSEETWRRREALLFVLGYFLERSDLGELERLGATGFTSTLVPAVLAVDLATGAPLALSARALVLLDVILKRDTSARNRQDICHQVLMPCILTLHGNLTMVTAVAVVLLQRVLKHSSHSTQSLDAGVGEGALNSLLRCLLSPDLSDDVLYIFVETCLAILKQGQALGISKECWAATVPQLMNVWRAHLRDPNMGEMITDALSLIIRQQCADSTISAELGWLRDVLCGFGSIEMLCIIPYVVRFIKVVMQHASMGLVNTAASALLEPLCQLLLTNDDSSIAVGAADCLGAVLYRAADGLQQMSVVVTKSLVYLGDDGSNSYDGGRIPSSEWMNVRPPTPPLRSLASPLLPDPRLSPMPLLDEPPQSVPLSDVLIAIVDSLLREDRSEISLLNVGAYLGAVASCATLFTEQQMTRFLKAVIRRLIVDPVQSKTATAQLLLPLAILLQSHPAALVSTLSRLDCLGPVLEKWLCMLPALAEDATGVTTLAHSLTAFMAVLNKNTSLVDAATLAQLEAGIVLWRGGRDQRPVPLPLPHAAFIAVAKVACVIISRPMEFNREVGDDVDAGDDSDTSDGDDDDVSDDNDDDQLDESVPANSLSPTSTASPLTAAPKAAAISANIPAAFSGVLRELVRLAPQYYGASTQSCFTTAEAETLSWYASTLA